jgi:very-short-patch-repair endonuclease
MKKLTNETYDIRLNNKHKGKIIRIEDYVNMMTPILHECCVCGYKWKTYPILILYKTGCLKCVHEKLRIYKNSYKDILLEKNIEYVSGVFLSNKSVIRVKCLICTHEWNILFSNFLSGHGCPKCAIRLNKEKSSFTLYNCYELAKERGIECLSNEYQSARKLLRWKCLKCKQEWEASYDSIKRGSCCPFCYNKKRGSSQRLTHEDIKKRIEESNLELKDEISKYKNTRTKLCVKCERGHIFKTTLDQIKRRGSTCIDCFREIAMIYSEKGKMCIVGKNEYYKFTPYLKQLLDGFEVIPQYMVQRPLESTSGLPYFIDFVVPKLKLAIEYDEKHHKFVNFKEKDEIREKYIIKHTGFNIIRITDEEFMTYNRSIKLEEYLLKLGVSSGFGSSGR